MHRYRIIIAYDGTNYAGWQVQETGLAIQPVVQKALETILRHPVDLTGSGRTDAGVHALGQTAHFDSPLTLDPRRICFSLNALLPTDIRVIDLEPTESTFHARYSAISKIYHYHMHLGKTHDPFQRLYQYHILGAFDRKRLKEAAKEFLGTHDFTSFANQAHRGSASHDPVRTLTRLDVAEEGDSLRLEFEADGFLYKMVRNITGTLVDVAQGRFGVEEIAAMLKAKDRRKAGSAAPPHGLFLMRVNY